MRRARDLAVAVTALVAAFALVQWWDFTLPSPGGASYQAVFLANGQTYFGRYHDRIGPYAKLDSVYYIQQNPPAEPDQPGENRLIRRGGELHGPPGVVLVPKSAVLFVEDLRDDSPVTRFIEEDRRR